MAHRAHAHWSSRLTRLSSHSASGREEGQPGAPAAAAPLPSPAEDEPSGVQAEAEDAAPPSGKPALPPTRPPSNPTSKVGLFTAGLGLALFLLVWLLLWTNGRG